MEPLVKKLYLLIVVLLGNLVFLPVNAHGGMSLEEIDLLSEEEQLAAYQMLVEKEPQNPRFQNSLGFCTTEWEIVIWLRSTMPRL